MIGNTCASVLIDEILKSRGKSHDYHNFKVHNEHEQYFKMLATPGVSWMSVITDNDANAKVNHGRKGWISVRT